MTINSNEYTHKRKGEFIRNTCIAAKTKSAAPNNRFLCPLIGYINTINSARMYRMYILYYNIIYKPNKCF